MTIIHPEVLAALKKAGESPRRGPWTSLTIFPNGTAQAVFQHGLVQFDAEGEVITGSRDEAKDAKEGA